MEIDHRTECPFNVNTYIAYPRYVSSQCDIETSQKLLNGPWFTNSWRKTGLPCNISLKVIHVMLFIWGRNIAIDFSPWNNCWSPKTGEKEASPLMILTICHMYHVMFNVFNEYVNVTKYKLIYLHWCQLILWAIYLSLLTVTVANVFGLVVTPYGDIPLGRYCLG